MSALNPYIAELMEVQKKVQSDSDVQALWHEARDTIVRAIREGHTVYIAGNGGSAADAQHFAAELVGRFKKERRAYAAIALTTDTSALTAIGNDYGFIKIFSRQLEALGQEGDVFVAISTSGNSPNLIHASVVARQKHMRVIGLLGKDGGMLKEFVHVPIVVPSEVTAHIQEIHQEMYHCWCAELDELLP